MFEADVHRRSFLLSKTTPTIATSNNTETISNGSRYCVNNNLPREAVPPSSPGDSVAPSGAFKRLLRKIARMDPTEINPPTARQYPMFGCALPGRIPPGLPCTHDRYERERSRR